MRFFTAERLQEFDRSMAVDSALPIFIVGMPRSGTTLVEQLLASHQKVHGAGELTYLRRLIDRLPSLSTNGESFPDCLSGLQPAAANAIASEYIAYLGRLATAPGIEHVTDKMPSNVFLLGLIALCWPRSKIVHCRRDPMAVGFSCFTREFADHQPFAWDLTTIGHYWQQYERLHSHWQQVLPIQVFEM